MSKFTEGQLVGIYCGDHWLKDLKIIRVSCHDYCEPTYDGVIWPGDMEHGPFETWSESSLGAPRGA